MNTLEIELNWKVLASSVTLLVLLIIKIFYDRDASYERLYLSSHYHLHTKYVENTSYTGICVETNTILMETFYSPYTQETVHLEKFVVSNCSSFLTGPGIERLDWRSDIDNVVQSQSNKNWSASSSFPQSFVIVKDESDSSFLSQIAICEFQKTRYSAHPPHAFQQLTRCMSYWRYRQQNSNLTILPVLIWPSYSYQRGLYSESYSYTNFKRIQDLLPKKKFLFNEYVEFTCTLVKELVQEFNVLVTTKKYVAIDVSYALGKMTENRSDISSLFKDKRTVNHSVVHKNFESKTRFRTENQYLDHLKKALLSARVYSNLTYQRMFPFAVNDDMDIGYYTSQLKSKYRLIDTHLHQYSQQQNTKLPRIGIVNRRNDVRRSLINVNSLVHELQSLLQDYMSLTEDAEHVKGIFGNLSERTVFDIPVAYFEEATFLDQISFYASMDIIISPHGAQLTALPFMATPPTSPSARKKGCKALIEIFPQGYYRPFYYGSLAISSNIQYRPIYVSESGNATQDGKKFHVDTIRGRNRVRGQNLCPQQEVIITAARLAIQEWQNCEQ